MCTPGASVKGAGIFYDCRIRLNWLLREIPDLGNSRQRLHDQMDAGACFPLETDHLPI